DISFAFGGPERYLQTTIVSGQDIGSEQAVLPRQQMTTVPFATKAREANQAAVAALAENLVPKLAQGLNPPRTVIQFVGVVPDGGGVVEPVPGYLLCNGAVLSKAASGGKYMALMAVIGTSWGTGGDSDDGNAALPDLRGVFLRGWSGSLPADDPFGDPDRVARVSRLAGGNTGNYVGSFQKDMFMAHNHPGSSITRNGHNNVDGGTNRQVLSRYVVPSDPAENGGDLHIAYGGTETRGRNANVVFLIKY
ncbi:MAG: tail fiber protein, partial [Verrucomicrobiaceae bacterium]